MDSAKLRLSTEEMDLISRADWILTKNRLMERVRDLLASLQEPQWQLLKNGKEPLPEIITSIPAKISRGENYEGLPWIVLDLPRYFTNEDQCAIRSLFWWGHGFSLTLQLKGQFRQQWQEAVLVQQDRLSKSCWYICTGDDLWQHHFREDNYTAINSLSQAEWHNIITGHPFLKIAWFVPMQKWEAVPSLLMEQYGLLTEILAGS